ncbi:hypothetical protein BV25DRAFT_1766125, partial [Artomyces pyxidatus]
PPRPFKAANKENFGAIGSGELVVELPDGLTTSQLRLFNVLYSPAVAYTLISVGKLDELGYRVTFGGG